MLTNDIVSFEQLGPGFLSVEKSALSGAVWRQVLQKAVASQVFKRTILKGKNLLPEGTISFHLQ